MPLPDIHQQGTNTRDMATQTNNNDGKPTTNTINNTNKYNNTNRKNQQTNNKTKQNKTIQIQSKFTETNSFFCNSENVLSHLERAALLIERAENILQRLGDNDSSEDETNSTNENDEEAIAYNFDLLDTLEYPAPFALTHSSTGRSVVDRNVPRMFNPHS